MPQNFIACDREQALLLPPSLLDWVPADHLVWTVLASVEEMDLSGFYGVYRPDGHGRPAYDPKVMVALLFYACAQGVRSSREIERKCREDVAFMVITAMRVPDHSTIAEFRKRHERALAGLFGDVLGMCEKAGLVKVGVIAIDGTKISANASMGANRSYERIARGLLDELEETDRREDELHGDARGDELPEQLCTPEGRRAALREAKRQLDAERESAGGDGEDRSVSEDTGGEESLVVFDFDRERILNSEQGRRGWMREGRHQLDELRRQQARPIAASRTERLEESKRRLEEEHRVGLEANAAYEAYKARGVMRDGRRFGKPSKPYVPPAEPTATINTTDHDSRIVRTTGQPARQGYNAQAAVNEHQIIIAAEVTVDSPDFGHLEPMVDATQRELAAIGVSSLPETVVADPGYWHKPQMQNIVARGIQVLIPPDSGLRTEPRPGWNKGLYAFMRMVLSTEFGQAVYRRRMATVEPVFGQMKFNRRFDRFQRRGLSAVTSECLSYVKRFSLVASFVR
ncbi:MAG: transposase [Solirubrobacteraceae bacterium]